MQIWLLLQESDVVKNLQAQLDAAMQELANMKLVNSGSGGHTPSSATRTTATPPSSATGTPSPKSDASKPNAVPEPKAAAKPAAEVGMVWGQFCMRSTPQTMGDTYRYVCQFHSILPHSLSHYCVHRSIYLNACLFFVVRHQCTFEDTSRRMPMVAVMIPATRPRSATT